MSGGEGSAATVWMGGGFNSASTKKAATDGAAATIKLGEAAVETSADVAATEMVDAACGCCCLLMIFSKNVDLMADLRRKYVCRSTVALVEMTCLWRSF